MDKHRCPYCGQHAMESACLGNLQGWDTAPNGQHYHRSCKSRALSEQVNQDMAMFSNFQLGPGGVRRVKE